MCCCYFLLSLDILIGHDGSLKLADFGLARIYTLDGNDAVLSHQVCTRWYRPPELLYGSKTYDLTVDVWSAGAVLAEVILLRPLFPGNSDIDQMAKVFQVMGSPTTTNWPVRYCVLIYFHVI